MDPTTKIHYCALENPKYRILFDRCHVTTATKILSLLFIGYYIVSCTVHSYYYGAELHVMIIILLLSLIYLTPFLAVKTVQSWILIPLLVVLTLNVVNYLRGLTDYLFAFFQRRIIKNNQELAFHVGFTFFLALQLYLTIRSFQYLKEMKIHRQKQQQQMIHELNA